MINVQTQNTYFSQYQPDVLYFPDNVPSGLPLSMPGPNDIDKDALRRIFQNEQQKPEKSRTTVEIQKTEVSEFGSTIEQEPYGGKRNNIVNRQIPTPPPSGETLQQFGQQRQQFLSQIAPNRQTAQQQLSYPRPSAQQQSKPDISLGRPSVPVPQSELNRPTIQQITLGRPSSSQTSQDGQGAPQSKPDISLNRPSVAVPQDALDRPIPQRPAGPQFQSNPPRSTSGLNYPAQQAPGYNTLLYSVTNFGVNMLKAIDGVHPGNVVISPFSVTTLLGLLQQGAVGQTQAQITNALQMSPETTAPAYTKVSEDIQARNSRNILKVASNLFVSEDFAISQEFRKVGLESFNSDVTTLSFQRSAEAARQINSWVASRTDHRIEQLIAPDAVDYTTQMVLVNAIYFKGLWEVPFRSELTHPKEFELSNGQRKTAQFMRIRKLFKTGMDKTTSAKVIVLPFERDEYHLMVILPSQLVGMKNTLASLSDARLLSYLSFRAMDTELELPKFTIRADTDLSVILKQMGVTDMFRRDYSDLSGVGAYGAHSPHVSSAVHSAVLSIDEKGGSAAAATAFAAVALSYDNPSVEFRVNRPFIAVLWDTKSSLPLFMAKIEDPQQ